MSIKDIIVYVDNDSDCENRLELASSLCKAFEARLTGLYMLQKISIPTYVGAYMPVTVFEANDEETIILRDKAKAVFTGKSESAGISGQFSAFAGDVSAALNEYSRYAELMIVPQRKSGRFDFNPYYRLSDILLGAACPILLLPENNDISPVLPPETVLLAWDGKRECARALLASMPMLSQVKKIDVVSVNCEGDGANQIALHIARHGIEAKVHTVKDSQFDIGEYLINQAARLESDMIVMGAYGHSRVRELMLGGTTRHILEHIQLPVLFSH